MRNHARIITNILCGTIMVGLVVVVGAYYGMLQVQKDENEELSTLLGDLQAHIVEQEKSLEVVQEQYATLSLNAEKLTAANNDLTEENKVLNTESDELREEVSTLKKLLRTLE